MSILVILIFFLIRNKIPKTVNISWKTERKWTFIRKICVTICDLSTRSKSWKIQLSFDLEPMSSMSAISKMMSSNIVQDSVKLMQKINYKLKQILIHSLYNIKGLGGNEKRITFNRGKKSSCPSCTKFQLFVASLFRFFTFSFKRRVITFF